MDTDYTGWYEQLPSRSFATRLPPDAEPQLRALVAAFKATGMPHSGQMYAAGVAGIMLAELTAAGWTLCPPTTAPRSSAQAESDGGGVLAAAAEGRGGER